MVQEKKDKDKMINFNSLWRNVAEHGYNQTFNKTYEARRAK